MDYIHIPHIPMFDRATVFAGQTNVLIILLGSIAITACGSMFIFVRQTAGLVGQIGQHHPE